jgi:hypothetical protein
MKNALKWIARSFGYEIHRSPQSPKHFVFDELMDLDYETLKIFANRAAQFSASTAETQAVRNLHLTGLLREQPYSESCRVEIGGANTLEVGLWRKNSAKEDTFDRRADRGHEWFYWADRKAIGPKQRKWRVVLLGESVARGYLYDPHFNPAVALEKMLQSELGTEEIEVVDLAKSNLTIQELKVIVGQCLALCPDIIIIFAGNNWRSHVTEPSIPYVESLLRTEGVPGMKSFLDERREESVKQLISQVNSLLGGRDVKVIWIVPEFNLNDWADPISNAPHLPRRGNKQWRDLGDDASQALHAHDHVRAEHLAKRMVDIDGGTSSVPLRILAECCESRGDVLGRRRYLELCRDAEGWDPSFSYSPRVSSSIQRALRGAASVSGNFVIDLPDVLSRHLNCALPDRRVFLDYCHLTAEGINAAMAAVASRVMTILTGKIVPLESLQSGSIFPGPKVEGKACLLAAVHNAHFYQGYDVVHYWCVRALQFWPECANIMLRFADFQTRRTPVMACKSAIEIFASDELDTVRYLMRGGKHHLDIVLIEAIVNSVKATGVDVGKEISDLRVKEHSTRSGPKELTELYYCSAIPGPSESAWTSRSFLTNRGSHSIYASALWRKSKFIFFAEEGQSLGLRFTYRVPTWFPSGSVVEIDVNGRRIAQAPADRMWKTFESTILEEYLIYGLNEIMITWPDGEDSSELELNRAADALVARRLPYFHRVFGEIHSLLIFDPDLSAEFDEAASLSLNRAATSTTEIV